MRGDFLEYCSDGNLKAVIEILPEIENINERNRQGYNALMYALKNKRTSVIKYLLKKRAKVENITAGDGYTMFMGVCYNGLSEYVTYLVEESGSDIFAKDSNNTTPLLYASKGGSLEIVQYLIKNGADINDITKRGKDCLVYAVDYLNYDVIDFLLNYGVLKKSKNIHAHKFALMIAAAKGNVNIIKLFIEHKVNLNVSDEQGKTPLMISLNTRDLEVVKLFLENGVNVNAKDNEGKTALMICCAIGIQEIIKCLIEYNANVDSIDNKSGNMLLYAIEGGCLEYVKTFHKKYNQDINSRYEDDNTNTLMIACNGGYFEIVRYLVENGVDVNAVNKEGDTALNIAYFNSHVDIVNYLKFNGAKK